MLLQAVKLLLQGIIQPDRELLHGWFTKLVLFGEGLIVPILFNLFGAKWFFKN